MSTSKRTTTHPTATQAVRRGVSSSRLSLVPAA